MSRCLDTALKALIPKVACAQERWKAWQSSCAEARMRGTRSGLPASQRRAEFLQALQRSRVIVIQGATGSGKSTQMPQYVLEEACSSLWRHFPH